MATLGGPALPVSALTSPVQHEGGAAIPVTVVADGRATMGEAAQPVIVVTNPSRILGGPAIPVVAAPAGARVAGGPALRVYIVGGGVLDPLAYTNLVKAIFGASLIEYWTGAELSGTVALAEVNPARNGLYTAVTLAQPGIGDGRTAPLYSGAGSSRNNVYSANFASAFNGPVGTLNAWALCTNWADGTQRYIVYWQADANNKIYLSKATTNNVIAGNYVAGGTNISFSKASFNPSTFFPVAITWDKTTTNAAYFYVNGQRVAFLGSLGVWAGTFTSTVTCIGALTNTGTQAWNGEVAHVAVGNTMLNSADIALLHRIAGHVLCEGDSRTAWQLISWPQQMLASIALGWWTVGTGGATLLDMQARAAANIAAYYRAGLQKNVVCILGGLNDMLAGADLATIISRLSTLCLTYRNAGISVVVSTELDAQSAAANAAGWHTTMRPGLNAWILANYASIATRVADCGGQPQLSNALDGIYFAGDFVHPISAGYAVAASTFAAQVNAL